MTVRPVLARFVLWAGLVAVTLATIAGAGGPLPRAEAARMVSLSKPSGPPKIELSVSGSGFKANAAIDIYFDLEHLAMVIADSLGAFSGIKIQVPASAVPGGHWVTALERKAQVGAQTPFLVQADWPQFRYNARHRGYNAVENVLDVSTVPSLLEAWRYTTGGPIRSSPAVVKGIAYVGSDDGRLYAFEAATGNVVWSALTEGAIESSPAVAGGTVFVGSNDMNLYAFEAATGRLQWVTALDGAVRSSPAVAAGVVYVGTDGGRLSAVDTADGSKRWSAQTEGPITSSPAYAGGDVYVGSDDTKVYAFNGSTGAALWSATTGGAVRSSPSVANGAVFVGSDDGKLWAFRAATGQFLWNKFGMGTDVRSSPAAANGIVYMGSASPGQIGTYKLFGLDAESGFSLQSGLIDRAPVRSSPAVANGVIYVGADSGHLYAVPVARGGANPDPIWSALAGAAISSSPTVVDGRVFVGSEDGKFYAYDLGDRGMKAPGRPSFSQLRPDPRIRPGR